MSAVRISIMALVLLAGCGGNPLATTGGGGTVVVPPGTTAVPAVVKLNLNSADYTPGDATIKIHMTSQDAAALSATYTRIPKYDVDGYQAYYYQETTSNRYVLAMVKETGSVKGLIAVEGGQFANYHGGGDFVRADVFTMPTSGVGAKYDYSGSYVGMMNIGTALPGPGGDLYPTQAYRTTGRALITADFTEMSVSGGVDRRMIVDPLDPSAGISDPNLESIYLGKTDIASNGTFTGKVMMPRTPGSGVVGDYAGLFAGLDASQVAALLVFNPYVTPPIKEHGLIVLDNCVSAGGPAACP
ncbi:MAG: hypothetical protein ACOH2H_01975 [Cypionkella sp.]